MAAPAQHPIHPECEHAAPAAPTLSAPAPASGAAYTNAEATAENKGKGFLFDIIVVRLDVPNKAVSDPSKLSIGVSFYNQKITINSSRINVLDFKPEPTLEFCAEPLYLKEQLTNNPLRLKVAVENKVLGYATFIWPPDFLNGLIDCESAMTHTAESEIKECDGTKTGTIQIIARLQPRCEEYVEDNSPDGKCRNANKEIRPTDILFVVGEDKNPCCCAEIGIIPASDTENDMAPKCLDLSNFRCVNSQNVKDADVLNSVDPACQKLKSVTNQYEKIICALKSKGKTFCAANVKENNCDLFQSSSESLHIPPCCRTESKSFTTKNIRIAKTMTPPELVANEPEPLRCCPLCKENLSYLPKLAACPNCCYKPIPHFEEKPYNVNQNAEQIVKEYEYNFHDDCDDDSNSDLPKCRCTCQYGFDTPCAHCRIRKLCEEIYKPPSQSLMNRTGRGCCEAKSSEANCPSTDSRPILSKIFSELKDLNDIKEPKRKEFEPDERCEKVLSKSPIKKRAIHVRNNQANQPQGNSAAKKCFKRKKRCLKPASEKATKSRLYDYQAARQIVPINVGHKTCINGFAGRKNVPPNMGWLWNINQSGKWKPGAIRKPIKELMKYFLKDFPADTLLVSKYSYRKSEKNKSLDSSSKLVQKPTLHIYKHDGEYIITMRPLKCPHLLKYAADPYEDMKPVQFRITRNPRLTEIRKIKQFLKDMGFKKCTCHKPLVYCYCRSFLDKKKLEYLCKKECNKRQIPSCCDTIVLSDTSDSEAEFNFGVTPPAAIIKPERLRRADLVNVSTQYDEIDWNPPPLFPRPPNKYMQMYQCAIGERKAKRLNVGATGKSGVVCGKSGGQERKGGGDGVSGKGGRKGGKPDVAVNYGKRAAKKTQHVEPPSRKVDMMKYSLKVAKRSKMSPTEAAAKREKMKLLRGVNPPLLCMVDRRGKPTDPCAPCNDIRIC